MIIFVPGKQAEFWHCAGIFAITGEFAILVWRLLTQREWQSFAREI
jgi:hypothetical protein